MRHLVARYRNWLALLTALAMLVPLALIAVPASAETGPDYSITDGWFYTQTGGGQGQGYAVRDGFDSNGRAVSFWTEFRRLGGVDALGYPVGQPYVGGDGFTYQTFQRAILQWRPELRQAMLANTFELLSSAGRDSWLSSAKGVPLPIADDGSNGDYAKAVTTRLGWLTNDAIKTKFLANPNPGAITGWNQDRSIQLFGLPMSQPEKRGPFVVQRFQRISFQLWVEDVPGMPGKGTVVAVLGGDLAKEAGLLAAHAALPLGPGGSAPLATPTPVATATPTPPPAPVYYWRVSNTQGWPNCGTTYVRAYVRDAAGNGVNGIALKSWNDWGNDHIDSTKNWQGLDGYYGRVVSGGVTAGRWYVAILDGAGKQASDVAVVNFTASCEPDKGNVQEAELEFRPR